MKAFFYAIIHQNCTTAETADAKLSSLTTMMQGLEETHTIITMQSFDKPIFYMSLCYSGFYRHLMLQQ